MIAKYRFGSPFPTEATVVDLPCAQGQPRPFLRRGARGGRKAARPASFGGGHRLRVGRAAPRHQQTGAGFTAAGTPMTPFTPRVSPRCTARIISFVVCGEKPFGAFFDCAGRMTFDVGYTDPEELTVTAYEDFDLYIIRPDGAGKRQKIKVIAPLPPSFFP